MPPLPFAPCPAPLQVAVSLPGNTFAAAKDAVMGRTISSLFAYRKFCATQSSAVQV